MIKNKIEIEYQKDEYKIAPSFVKIDSKEI